MVDSFLLIAQQVAVLFILIGVGFLLGKKRILSDNSSKAITDIVLYAVTPCVMIYAFQRDFSLELLGKVAVAAIIASVIMLLSILLARLCLRGKEINRKKVLQFSVIFSNCGFMSLPLQRAVLGDDGWFFGSIFVAVFNLFVWTYGLADMSGDKKQLSVKKLALNPGLVGVTVALILFIFRVHLPEIVLSPVEHLSNLNTPLPMLVIGYYLSKADIKKAFTDKAIYAVMALRLVVIPVIAALIMCALRLDKTMIIAFTIASSAPTAATTTMFSAKFGRDIELSVSAVTATTLVSILTMPIVTALAGVVAQ